MATILASELELYRESVSRILLKLQQLNLAECTKPESIKFSPLQNNFSWKISLKRNHE
jgi:hypothetical protein